MLGVVVAIFEIKVVLGGRCGAAVLMIEIGLGVDGVSVAYSSSREINDVTDFGVVVVID